MCGCRIGLKNVSYHRLILTIEYGVDFACLDKLLMITNLELRLLQGTGLLQKIFHAILYLLEDVPAFAFFFPSSCLFALILV